MSTSTPSGGCLHEIFELQADATPDRTALIHDGTALTYAELDRKSNQLAHHLISLGAGPGALVGMCLDKSVNPIITLLSVLKTGAAYVPIDPAYPDDRISHIIDDASIQVIVTEKKIKERLTRLFKGKTVIIDREWPEIAERSDERIPCGQSGVSSGDLCYVMYTSGTTGRPKGVMTEHGNVTSFVRSFNKVIGVGPDDRVYQGFPYGFDGSVEETWMAFSNGATLVVGRADILRLGNEAARYLTENGVTVFSTVPTFLSSIEEDLPTVRLLIVSGEQCPAALVARWATNGRRLLNVYGPTETTVNTTAEDCRPDKPVTIGKPIEGYEIYVLDESRKPVPRGTEGELHVGGTGVSRGYLNLPAETAKQFILNPFNGATSSRLYRTGDLVVLDDQGDLHFLGRADTQVKVRGFRIELSEIEAVLCEHPSIRTAVATVHRSNDLEQIAAFVILHAGAEGLDRSSVHDLLKSKLTEYMIPQYLDVVDEIPTLTSGKVDRKNLPQPRDPLTRTGRTHVPPSTELERRVADVWSAVLRVPSVSVEDDFFLDLAGHSLVAAQVVSNLRKEHGLEVSIRDIYSHSTVAGLARLIASAADRRTFEDERARKGPSSREVFAGVPRAVRICCTVLQAITLYFLYGMGTMPLLLLFMLYFSVTTDAMSLTSALWIFAALSVGLFPFLLLTSVAAKWIIIGRYKPGSHPLWGFYYFRWWLASRFQMLSGAAFFAGTPLMSLYYRLMGAKVGSGCTIDTAACSIFDLVTIGDETSIGSETQIPCFRIEDGMLILGSVEIGKRCFIGIHSHLGLNTKMEDDSRLDDLSLLPDGEVIGRGEGRRGSPAESAQVSVPEVEAKPSTRGKRVLFGFYHYLITYMMEIALLLTALPSLSLLVFAYTINDYLFWALCIAAAIPLFEVSFCIGLAVAKAVVLRRLKPGIYSLYSLTYLRKWFVDCLMNISRLVVLPVYTTLYLPPWLRLLGAKLGKRVELSIVTILSPELLVTEEECFFADGSIVGGNRFHRGHVQVSENRVGRRSFIGNEAILPTGKHVGRNSLIGVLSAPPAEFSQAPDGTDWLGSPSFQLPHRLKVAAFDDTVTYSPSKRLVMQRWLVDSMRILIPSLIEIITLIAFLFLLYTAYVSLPGWALILTAPLIAMACIGIAVIGVVLVKNLFIGKFEPVIKPLWSMFVWLNEVVNGAYESIAAPVLSPLLGTPFFAPYLRLLGCRVGKDVYIGTTLFGEFDLVEIGDYAALDSGAIVQNHLFEDRVFKASHVRIGDECTVGAMSVVLYDTLMGSGSSIGPLSLLMKGETLPPRTAWQGIPTGVRELMRSDDHKAETRSARQETQREEALVS